MSVVDPPNLPLTPPEPWSSRVARYAQFVIPRVVGIVFLWAGAQKAIDPTKIIRVLEFDGLTQRAGDVRLAAVAAGVLALLEIGLGALLILGLWQRRVIAATIALLLGFSVQLAYLIFAQNPPADCGCVTIWAKYRDARHQMTIGLIRNAVMAVGLEWTRLRIVRAMALAAGGFPVATGAAGEAPEPPPAAAAPQDGSPGTA